MNLDDIRNRLKSLANSTGKKKDIWKPTDKHVVRLLPYPHGDEPILQLGFHYELGKNSVLCPNFNFGEPCPICEFAEKLRSWNDEDGNEKPEKLRKSDWEMFKKIQVKSRWFAPMVERLENGDVSEAKFWGFGKTIYELLLNMCLDEEMNELVKEKEIDEGIAIITDPKYAFDLKIDFKKANNEDGKNNTKSFPITEVKNTMRPVPLAKKKSDIDSILEQVKPITDVYPKVSSDEVNRIFMGFINGSVGEAPAEPESDGKEYSSNSAEKPVEGTKSLEEAFSSLANN